MKILNNIMEMFWLALGTVLIFVLGYLSLENGFDWTYLLIIAMPFGMFFARRIMRKKMENIDK